MKSVLAGLLLSLTATAWSGPIVVQVPAGRVPVSTVVAPRLQVAPGAFRPIGSIRTQAGYNFHSMPAAGFQAVPAAFATAGSALEFAPAASVINAAPVTAFELGSLSSEAAWQKAGEQFDFNFSAKKVEGGDATPVVAPRVADRSVGAKRSAPPAVRGAPRKAKPKAGDANNRVRPPKTINPTGKEETTKGKLPIKRPEEGGKSTYEPGLYSPSRLGEFEWNKDDYAFHWVLRHKVDKPKVIEAFLGGIVHQAFENLNDWIKGGKGIEEVSIDDMLETYSTLWEEQYENGKHKMEPGFDEKHYKQRGVDYIRSVFARLTPMYAKVKSGEVKLVFIEQKMFFTLNEKDSGKTYRFQGIPDLVIMYEENGQKIIEVTDFKTTLSPPGLDQLKKKEYQLTMYADAIEQNYPELAKGAKFFIRYNYKDFPHVFEATPEFRQAVRERVLTLLHEIEVFTGQVEANIEEWKRRIDPIHPPKKMAEATKLVDQWTKLHWKIETLKKEHKKLEAEADTIMEKLLAFAKATGNAVIPGKMKDAVLDQKENVKAPTKSEDEAGYEQLVKLVKAAGLWEQFSSLNLTEIKNVAKLAGHPHHALYEKIKHLVMVGMKQEMKLKDKSSEKK